MFKNQLALIIVLGWLIGLAAFIIIAALSGSSDGVEMWMGHMKTFSAITGPMVGAIAGYYFQADSARQKNDSIK